MEHESQHTEWKEAWRDEYLRWVCGFANATGGTLVIGKNDSGEVVGVQKAKKLLEDLPNKIRDLLGILVEVNLCESGSLPFLEIVVPAYPSPISFRGHYFQRVGSTLQELKGAALDRFLLGGQTWSNLGRCTYARGGNGRLVCFGNSEIPQHGLWEWASWNRGVACFGRNAHQQTEAN